MPSAGELLRAERTKRNRNLSEIADQTCISKRYLEAIEVDRVKDLPGEFFYKSFIRQYARALGLDERTTQQILSCAVPCDTDDPLPVMNEVYENAQVGKSRRWNAPTGLAVGLLVAVLAACSGLYALWQHFQTREPAEPVTTVAPTQAAPATSAQPEAAQQQPAAAQPSPEGPPAAPAEAPAPAVSAAANPVPQPTPESGKLAVELAAGEETWVSLSAEGKVVFSGVLEPGQTRQVSVAEPARLTVGNAAGVEVRLNGKPIGPIGPRGQVRIVALGTNGAQVVPPKSAAAPKPASTTP